ncbi:MAG: hypothetical protein KI790_02010 [Cyclobacteriaceae bacterium]|nr:hypothetical protein [Cyclobacteriaceae bacterium HetDA_MAG_MS6]
MKALGLVIFFLYSVPFISNGQFKYPHRYFDPDEYQSDKEVLCIDQSEDGTMYMGTGTSLLRFDGERWEEGIIPDKKIIYWLEVDDRLDRVYVGSSGEFGYFDNKLIYHTLIDRLGPEVLDFGAIWEVSMTTHGVYFRSSKYIFRYDQDQLTKIDRLGPDDSPFDIVFAVDDTIYTRIRRIGLAKIYDGQLEVLVDDKDFGFKCNAFVAHPLGMLIATRSEGLFLYANHEVKAWNVEINAYLKTHSVYHAIALSNGHFAFATLTGGVLIMDEEGRHFHSIKRSNYDIHEGTGYVFEDNRAGLWIGTKRGVARIDLNSPIRYYQLEEIDDNTSFTYFNNQLYFGSINGLFVLPEGASFPKKVSDFPNLVTRIFTADDLLIGTDLSATYQIKGQKAEMLFAIPVTSLTATILSDYDYAGGEQEGLNFFRRKNGWSFVTSDEETVKNVEELVEHDSILWGISSSVGLFGYDNGVSKSYALESPIAISVFEDTPVVTTARGFYSYQKEADEFEPYAAFNSLLPSDFTEVQSVHQNGDTTWILYFDDQKTLTGDVFLKDQFIKSLPIFDVRINQGVETQLVNEVLFVSNGEEIFRYHVLEDSDHMEQAKAIIRFQFPDNSGAIPYDQNRLRFDFSVNTVYSEGDNFYRYKIDGYHKEWSDWSPQNYMEIANLLEGDYNLILEARTPDREQVWTNMSFTILSPWFRTYWAYLGYFMLLGGLVWVLVRWRLSYLESERSKLERLVASRTSEIIEQKLTIEQSLKEREVLLREVHHRVKNNLQVISSIFNMQLKEAQGSEVKKLINEGQSRIKTMSLIHQKLYQSDKLNAIEIEDYVQGLISQINQLYGRENEAITCQVEANGIQLDIDTAIPVGLILNELLSNSYKYAFDGKPGKISISITKTDVDGYCLQYQDNGKGFPSGFDFDKTDSLGLKLVAILSRQLKGKLRFKNREGACIRIDFRSVVHS